MVKHRLWECSSVMNTNILQNCLSIFRKHLLDRFSLQVWCILCRIMESTVLHYRIQLNLADMSRIKLENIKCIVWIPFIIYHKRSILTYEIHYIVLLWYQSYISTHYHHQSNIVVTLGLFLSRPKYVCLSVPFWSNIDQFMNSQLTDVDISCLILLDILLS